MITTALEQVRWRSVELPRLRERNQALIHELEDAIGDPSSGAEDIEGGDRIEWTIRADLAIDFQISIEALKLCEQTLQEALNIQVPFPALAARLGEVRMGEGGEGEGGEEGDEGEGVEGDGVEGEGVD